LLARKSTLIVLNSVVGGVLGFVALKLVALYMGAGIYGQLGFATSLVGLVTFLGNFGFAKAHTKRVSEGRDVGDCVTTFTAWNLAIVSVYILVVVVGLIVNELYIGKRFVSTTETTILLVTLSEGALFLRKVARSTFEARVEAARSEFIVFNEHLTRTPLMIVFALFYASAEGRKGPIFDFLRDLSPGMADFVATYAPETLAIAVLAASTISMAVGFFLLYRHIKPGKFRYDLLKSYTEFGLPVFGAGSFNSLQNYADKATLGFFWSDAITGRYYGFQRLFSFMDALYSAVGSIIFPMISEHDAQDDQEAVRRLSREALRYLSMVSVPAAFGAVALADPIIRILLSADWLSAKEVFIALGFAYPVRGVLRTVLQIQYGTDQPRLGAGISMFNSAFEVVVTVLLVPTSLFGIPLPGLAGLGAAIGALSAAIVDAAIRIYSLHFPLTSKVWGAWGRQWLGAGLMGLIVWQTRVNFVPEVRWYILPLLVGYGGLIYFGILYLIGEFDKTDALLFWEAVNPGEMAGYIKDELAHPDAADDLDEEENEEAEE
jgi:O-antigen/teichoic acid export membrane protein